MPKSTTTSKTDREEDPLGRRMQEYEAVRAAHTSGLIALDWAGDCGDEHYSTTSKIPGGKVEGYLYPTLERGTMRGREVIIEETSFVDEHRTTVWVPLDLFEEFEREADAPTPPSTESPKRRKLLEFYRFQVARGDRDRERKEAP